MAKDVFDRIASPICYTIDNDSHFVLKEIWIEMPVATPSTSPKDQEKENAPLLLPLSSRNGFAPVGNKFEMCYDSKQDLSKWDTLSASVNSAQGWKQ